METLQQTERETLALVKKQVADIEKDLKLAQANYRIIVLELACKYHLETGDKIAEDGTIERKPKEGEPVSLPTDLV